MRTNEAIEIRLLLNKKIVAIHSQATVLLEEFSGNFYCNHQLIQVRKARLNLHQECLCRRAQLLRSTG